jgi:hypothetical protein
MRIGKVVEMPQNGSSYGIVSDEFGNRWTVDRGEFAKGASEGDEFAYRVEFYQQSSVPLLRRDD